MSRFSFEAIGTHWEIETPEPLGHRLERRILERIQQFDATYSRFRSDSLVSRVANAPRGGCFDFPEDSIALFELYDRLHAVTGGAVDSLVGRDLELLNATSRTWTKSATLSERALKKPCLLPRQTRAFR
jgi:thiamine biosynthesis lipoprotein